eukprot:m.224042 g.224042  ORF g.224042 m.224042 type:complete len:444 (+) comp17279_c0_seq9:132-1463(+)
MGLDNYTASKLAEALHSTPHYDGNFKAISHDLELDSPYYQAMIQLAWPWFLVAFIVTLRAVVMYCCCNYLKPKYTITTPPALRKDKVIFAIAVVLAMLALLISLLYTLIHREMICRAGICYSFAANAKVHQGVNDFIKTTALAQTRLDTLSDQVSSVSDACDTLAQQVKATDWPDPAKPDATQLESDLTAAASELDLLGTSIEDFDPTFANHDVDKYEGLRRAYTLGFTATVCAILFLCGLLFVLQYRFLTVLFVWILHLVVLLCLLLSGVELPLSVAVADLCMDPNTFVAEQLDDDVATFYVYCNPSAVSPFARDYADALDYLATSGNLVSSLAAQGINTTALAVGVSSLNASLGELQPYLECTDPHQLYVTAIVALCDTALPGIVGLLGSHAMAGLLGMIAVLILARLSTYMLKNMGFYLDDEAQGLMRSPSTRTTTSFLE